MKTEMLNRIKFVGPWGWEMLCKEWRLCGEFPGVNGMATEMRWGDTCRDLTGSDEPVEPVRVRVPVYCANAYGFITRLIVYPKKRWITPASIMTVPAWPIESHGLRYYVWRDTRGVLRFVERQ